MKLGIKNPEWEKKINENFDLYIEMIKSSETNSNDFRFAVNMLRSQLDFASFNSYEICKPMEIQEVEVK